MELIIGNKNYSSWSMRAWLALKSFEFDFKESRVALFSPGYKEKLKSYTSAARVPVLLHGDTIVYDSFAICEYLAELNPAMWPEKADTRARARSVAAEMHASFFAIRDQLPLNCRAQTPIQITDKVRPHLQKEIYRVYEIWNECLSESGGPFLFGTFTIADIMYAPLVSRFESYSIVGDRNIENYRDQIKQLKAYQEWHASAAAEIESISMVDSLEPVSLR